MIRRIFNRNFASVSTPKPQPQNLIEKIVQRYAVDVSAPVRTGHFVAIEPEHVMTHDNTAAVISKFKAIGAQRFKNPRQPVFTLDHDVQNKSQQNLAKYRSIEEFSRTHGVDFYGAGRGIGHQVVIEEGYALPYTMTVASDSHSNMYGGIGALGTPIVRTDAASIWATGRTWWQVPPVVEVILEGKLPEGCSGKDIIITLCGLFNKDEVLNTAIEFKGDGIEHLTIDDRLAIANMTTEWGALAGVFPVDHRTIRWLRNRAFQLSPTHPRINEARISAIESSLLRPDPFAHYTKSLTLDLATLSPHISGPNAVKVATPLHQVAAKNITVHKAYLVSCVNSRAEDIRAAARVMRGKKVHPKVEFYIAAASSEVQKEVVRTGEWQHLLDAGAKPLPAGCGPCIGLGIGLLKDGEVGISATNRNFKGRMGSPNADAYLASPVIVAASAIAGRICGPEQIDSAHDAHTETTHPPVRMTLTCNPPPARTANSDIAEDLSDAPMIPGFPRSVSGELLFCHADNLNTDGIYPGKYTYQDDITSEEMGRVVMENYDADFAKMVKRGDILIGGFNFGAGSSREQAATALISAGIRLVIAGSFSETFKRNALNNALLVLESPELVRDLLQAHGTQNLSVRTRRLGRVDFAEGVLTVELGDKRKEYHIPKVGKAAQELIVEGGLENWVKNRSETKESCGECLWNQL